MVIVVKWLSHVNGCGCRFGSNGDKMQKKHSRVIYGVDAAVVGSSIITRRKNAISSTKAMLRFPIECSYKISNQCRILYI